MEDLKTFLKSKFFKIILVIIILVLLGVFIKVLKLETAIYKEGDMSNTPYVASKYTSSVKFSDEGIRFSHINEETGVEEEKTSSEMAQILWDEMMKTKTKVKNYLDDVEELEKLMNAEIITQYPKLPGDNVGLNGTVQFKRHKTDGTSVMLEYIDKATFDSYIEQENLDIINYFTLDENHQLLIGVIDTTTEELIYDDPDVLISDYSEELTEADKVGEGNYNKLYYKVTSKSLNYKDLISKYTMPFQYLWSLIVIGDDKDVGLKLADLVEDSEIIISIYDNITTTVDKSKYTYDRERKVDVSATATCYSNYGDSQRDGKWTPAEEWQNENESYEVNYTLTYEANLIVFDVSKADVWIVDYSKECTYQASTLTSEVINEKDLEDTEYVDADNNPRVSVSGDGSDLPYYDKFKEKLDELKNDLTIDVANNTDLTTDENGVEIALEIYSTEITSCEASYYKHNINIHKTKTDIKYEQKYISQTPVNNPKIQKKTEEEIRNGTGEDNFVTILLDPEHSQARYKLTYEVRGWLFEILEANDDTKDMIDLTKYLFYVVTGKDRYGISDYDFSIYESDSFTSVTGAVYGDSIYGNSIYGDSIQEKVWFMLKDLGYSDIAAAGAMGNIHYESETFNPLKVEIGFTETTGGIGICQWTDDKKGPGRRNTNLRAFAASRETTWQDENIQVEFLRWELTPGGGLDGLAEYQLLTTRSYFGSDLACPSAWINATSIEQATMAFCYSFERPGKNEAQESMTERIDYARQYYDLYVNMEPPLEINTTLTGENKSKMQSMLSEAVKIADNDKYIYDMYHRDSQYSFDCASFVARLYEQFFGFPRLDIYGPESKVTYNVRYNSTHKYGKQVSLNSLQPGDIIWIPGHVALYLGDNQIVEAANSTDGIRYASNWMAKEEGVEAYRIIF